MGKSSGLKTGGSIVAFRISYFSVYKCSKTGLNWQIGRAKMMHACFHHGSKQIGGSHAEVESQGQILFIDFGLPESFPNIECPS